MECVTVKMGILKIKMEHSNGAARIFKPQSNSFLHLGVAVLSKKY